MMHSHVPRGIFSLSYLWFQMPNSSNELAWSHHPNSQIKAAILAFTCELICCLMNKLWDHRNGLEQGQSLVREPQTDLKQWGYLTSLNLLSLSIKQRDWDTWPFCAVDLKPRVLTLSLGFPSQLSPVRSPSSPFLALSFCTIALRPATVT